MSKTTLPQVRARMERLANDLAGLAEILQRLDYPQEAKELREAGEVVRLLGKRLQVSRPKDE